MESRHTALVLLVWLMVNKIAVDCLPTPDMYFKSDYTDVDDNVPESRSPTPTNAVLIFAKLPRTCNINRTPRIFHEFPVEVNVKPCPPRKGNKSSARDMVIGSQLECRCKECLDSNTEALVKWARKEHNMATGMVMAYNNSNKMDKNYFGNNMNEPRWRRDPRIYQDCRNDAKSPYEDTDKLMQTSQVMRQMFLGPFMNTIGATDMPPIDRPSPANFNNNPENCPRPDLATMIRSTIVNLQQAATTGCKGFLLLVKAEGETAQEDLNKAVVVVLNETDPTTTLLVVSSLCPEDTGSVKMYAKGPNSFVMKYVRLLPQVPKFVKEALMSPDPPTSSDDDELRGGLTPAKRFRRPWGSRQDYEPNSNVRTERYPGIM